PSSSSSAGSASLPAIPAASLRTRQPWTLPWGSASCRRRPLGSPSRRRNFGHSHRHCPRPAREEPITMPPVVGATTTCRCRDPHHRGGTIGRMSDSKEPVDAKSHHDRGRDDEEAPPVAVTDSWSQQPQVSGDQHYRNLALDLVRVTEAAALAAAPWVGRGDKNAPDGAVVAAMRTVISTVRMAGNVVIGEGEKDEAPMLFNGEQVGDGTGPHCDVAVDPIDGTRLTALGMPNAISVMAVTEDGAMYDPSAVFYMEKLVTGPAAADAVDLRLPIAENIRRVAKAKRTKDPASVTVMILDRPRHQQMTSADGGDG